MASSIHKVIKSEFVRAVAQCFERNQVLIVKKVPLSKSGHDKQGTYYYPNEPNETLFSVTAKGMRDVVLVRAPDIDDVRYILEQDDWTPDKPSYDKKKFG